MANLDAWNRTMPLTDEHGVEELFRTRYLEMARLDLEMARLAGLLGADDPEDIAQEAFTRLMRLLGFEVELVDIHRFSRRAAGRGSVRRRGRQPRQAGVFLRLRPRERAPGHAAAGRRAVRRADLRRLAG
jgi:hypothetical protein